MPPSSVYTMEFWCCGMKKTPDPVGIGVPPTFSMLARRRITVTMRFGLREFQGKTRKIGSTLAGTYVGFHHIAASADGGAMALSSFR